MADVDAPTYTVDLTQDQRANLIRLLPRQADSTTQSRAIHSLRERLDPDIDGQVAQHPDGMIETESDETAEVELQEADVSLIALGIDDLEDQGQVPTSRPAIKVFDKIEPVIDEVKSDDEDDE